MRIKEYENIRILEILASEDKTLTEHVDVLERLYHDLMEILSCEELTTEIGLNAKVTSVFLYSK